MKFQFLRDKVKITEYRDGAIWRTKTLGRVWTDTPECYVINQNDEMFVTPSTKILMKVRSPRKVNNDTPSEVAYSE